MTLKSDLYCMSCFKKDLTPDSLTVTLEHGSSFSTGWRKDQSWKVSLDLEEMAAGVRKKKAFDAFEAFEAVLS